MSTHHVPGALCLLCEDKLKSAHPLLAEWFRAKKKNYLNLHIAWAYRNAVDQNAAYKEGKSNAQFPNSPHNKEPAQALDIFLINEDGEAVWPPVLYAKIAQESKDEYPYILWGGNFSGPIQRDRDHFELIMNKLTPSGPKMA
jgi:hypothetical protein